MSINIDGSCNTCVLTIGGSSSNTSCCDSCSSGGTCEPAKARMCMDMITVHFDQFSTGDTALQFPGFSIYNDAPITNPLMIFDSEVPTVGIERLGTQNETIGGGPGIGAAGEAGQPGENAVPQYKILIISADPPTPVTPTPEPAGGLITLEFYDDVLVREVHLLNVTTPCTQLRTFDFNNTILDTKYAVPLGLNSFQIISFDSEACDQSAVRKLTIKLTNDAAICKIIYDQCLNPALPCVETLCEHWDSFIEGATNVIFPGGNVTSDSPILNPTMIFNSSIPTAGKTQLGTPNILAVPPGPGVGAGGEPGQPGQNLFDLGHVLIISADANPLIPDAASSGQFIFTFTDPVLLKEVDFLNADVDGTTIELFDDGGVPIDFINVPGLGVNSFQKIQTTLPYLTKTMIITIVSTTAITKVCYAMCEGGGSSPIPPPDVVLLPDNAFTPVDIPSTIQQGTYMLVVKSVNADGASATFMASSAFDAQAGSVARITSAPSITDETVNILWPSSSKVQLYHDTLKTGGVGALIPYNVRITTI